MSQSDQSAPSSSASASMWNGWAFGMFTGLTMLALVIALFLSYTGIANAQREEDRVHAEQQACISALRSCHDGRFVPRICAMRARLGMETTEGAPAFGPGNLSCAQAAVSEANYCDVAKTACQDYSVTIPSLD